MMEPIHFAPRLAVNPKDQIYDPFAGWAVVREMEMRAKLELRANMAELHELQRMERRSQLVMKLVDNWPIAMGMLLGAMARAIHAIVANLAPWVMNVVFPFVVLAGRPELHLGGAFAHWVPMVVLYIQFPLEGVIVKKVLKRRITFSGFAIQLSFYHFFGAMQLLLVSGTFRQLLVR